MRKKLVVNGEVVAVIQETLIYKIAVWLTTTQGWDTQDAKDALRCDFGISSEEVEEIFAEIK